MTRPWYLYPKGVLLVVTFLPAFAVCIPWILLEIGAAAMGTVFMRPVNWWLDLHMKHKLNVQAEQRRAIP